MKNFPVNNKWLRRAAWAAGSVVVIWGLAYAVVPTVAKAQIEKIASEKLGRRVTVGVVDFKPWSLELTVTDLAIAKAAQSATAQLSAPRPHS